MTSSPAKVGAWATLVGCIIARAISSNDPFPIWSGDPIQFPAPSAGLGPAAGLVLDIVAMFSALALLVMQRRTLDQASTMLVGAGALGVAIHSHLLPGASLDDVRIGTHWASAMLGALALAHACRERSLWNVTWALVLGAACMLAGKACLQVFVEHPNTVSSYWSHRSEFLASQGWAPDSFMARSYERRLLQSEASGWFGLSNVLASFAALTTVALIPLASRAWWKARSAMAPFPDGFAGLLTLGAGLAVAVLYFTRSKGAMVAAAMGLLLIVIIALVHAWPTSRAAQRLRPFIVGGGGAIGLAFLVAPILAVVARGTIGESIGERSLLFRAFYLVGGARTLIEHPLLGVGPAGFKDAYLVSKPPLSPEDVDSAHCLSMDHAAMLGLLGAAWIAVVGLWAWRAGQDLGASSDGAPRNVGLGVRRQDVLLIAGVAAAATALSGWSELAIASPEAALMRLLALLAWIGVSSAALALFRTVPWPLPITAGGLALAAHLQFDVTATWVGAAPLALAALAAARAPNAQKPSNNPVRRSRIWRVPVWAPLTLVAIGGPIAGLAAAPEVIRWEAALRRAGAIAAAAGEMTARVRAMATGQSSERPDALVRELERWTGRQIELSGAGLEAGLAEVVGSCLDRSAEILESVEPRHFQTWEAASRARLVLAISFPDETGSNADRAVANAGRGVDLFPSSRSFGWLGTVHMELFRASDDAAHRAAAIDAWVEAARMDPRGTIMAVRLFEAHREAGEGDLARLWAALALQNDDLQRLDPLRQLRPEERQELARFLADP